jgi:hypothetical protein
MTTLESGLDATKGRREKFKGQQRKKTRDDKGDTTKPTPFPKPVHLLMLLLLSLGGFQ